MEKQQANGVRKGAWTKEEDILLTKCIHKFGQGRWHLVPLRAGLNRCRKSCRLRWLNYLNPNVKRGFFTQDEVDLIMRMHKLLGNRWSLIAGRIPGRTANDIKNFWNTHIHKKTTLPECCNNNINVVIRPQPQKVSPRLLHHQPSPSELIIMTPSKTNQLAAEDNDFPSNLITENEIPTNTQQPLDDDDQLVPDDEVGESMSWWAKLINTCTENDNGARSVVPFSFPEDNDHQPMILSQGSGDQANVKHLSTSIDDCGYDLDAMWELMNMDKY